MSLMNALAPANRCDSSRSDLNIKYLQDFWGSLLDMTTTVGQTFIDRACDVDISNSIVKVVRFPPTPSELENPFRCASLAPESSARPRKRGFAEFTERVQTELRDAPYANTFAPQQLISSQRMSKRQRKINLNVNDVGNHLIPIQSTEVFDNTSSQDPSKRSIIQRSSSIQVDDSQRSYGVQSTTSNPSLAGDWLIHIGRTLNGTPLSFPPQSPQGPASFNHRGNIAIPESPHSRESSPTENPSLLTTERELGNAKSASPELDSSIHGMSRVDNPSKSLEKNGIDEEGFGIRNRSASAVPKSPSLKSDPAHAQAIVSKPKENLGGQDVISESDASLSKPKFRLPARVESSNLGATSSKVRDIFDPIDTEEEQPGEPLNLRRVKRLKSNVSLPSTTLGGHQSPLEDIRPGLSTFPQTLLAQKMSPVDLELLGLDGQDRLSTLANTFKQTSSPAKDVQETINGTTERLPSTLKPYDISLESQNEANAASECASIINEQVRSTLPNPLKGSIHRANSPEEPPSVPQKGLSQPILAGVTVESPLRDYKGERKDNSRAKGSKESSLSEGREQTLVNSSLGHDTKDEQPNESMVVSKIDELKSPENPFGAKQSKTMNLEENDPIAKSADEKSEEQKLADRVEQENARRQEVVRQISGQIVEAKPLQGKQKPLKATNAKAGKSKVRGENHTDMHSSEKTRMADGGEPKIVKAVEPNKARRDEAAKETKMQHSVKDRSEASTARGVSTKHESVRSVTPKPKVHSDAQTHSSVTSNPRNDANRTRKSITPAFPGPSSIKQTSAESRPSNRTPSRPPTKTDSSLQNDATRTSRTLSRPISSSKAPTIPSSSQDLVPGIGAQTDRKGKNSGIANEKYNDISKIKKELNSESLMKTAKYSTEKTPKQEKNQTKLNKFIDVKGKGRLNDPPIRSIIQSQEPIILSSADEESASSFDSDEDINTKEVKARPSRKRKEPSRAELSNDKASAKEISTSGLGGTGSQLAQAAEKQASLAEDQAINARWKTPQGSKVTIALESSTARNRKTEEPRPKTSREKAVQQGAESHLQAIKQERLVEEPALPPSSIVDPEAGTNILSAQNSSPRPPARYMSKPFSISSGSDTDSDSEADSEPGSDTDSESDSESSSIVEFGNNADARKLPKNHPKSDEPNSTASLQNSARKARMELIAQEKRIAQRKGPSSSLTPLNVNSSSLVNLSSNKNSVREADEQLQREHRQSVGPNLTRASPTASQLTSNEEPKLSRPPKTNGASVESKLRPSNYPYPSMTEMKEKRSEKLRSQNVTNGSVSRSTLYKIDPKLLSPGSTSDSSSNSGDDSEIEQDARLESTKSKPNKTMQRLLKGKFTNKRGPFDLAENVSSG